jgi:4-hydroxy-3-methylbut-2-enyl diphosphate reductase
MKILLAEHFGICFGVRDAIAHAQALAHEAPLTILGQLVHNPLVRERLQAQGITEASLDDTHGIDILPLVRAGLALNGLEAAATTQRVMITAHGASDEKRAIWQNAGFDVVDGTCPLVRHAHEQLKQLATAGYFPVVIGKPGHVEVRGLTEDFPEACVINVAGDIAKLPPRDRYGVISQTTQPIDHVRGLVSEIQRRNPRSEVRFVDTVCKPTKDRQSALRALIAKTELIVIVGGRESNNTRQLVETCRAAGRRAIHIERVEELDEKEFEGIESVGLSAGTSTLRETVDTVFQRLKEIARAPRKTSS